MDSYSTAKKGEAGYGQKESPEDPMRGGPTESRDAKAGHTDDPDAEATRQGTLDDSRTLKDNKDAEPGSDSNEPTRQGTLDDSRSLEPEQTKGQEDPVRGL